MEREREESRHCETRGCAPSLNFWRRHCSELSPCITKMSSEAPLADQSVTQNLAFILHRGNGIITEISETRE